MRISWPPTISPCFYGIDTPPRERADRLQPHDRGDPRVHRGRLARLPQPRGAADGGHAGERTLLHGVLHRRVPGGVSPRPAGLSAARPEARRPVPRRPPEAEPVAMSGAATGRPASTSTPATRPFGRIKRLARGTFTPGVLSEIGSFGGLFRSTARGCDRSGAGVERRRRRHQAQGRVHGRRARHHRPRPRQPLRQRHPGARARRPLFFLDYVATGRLDAGRRRADRRRRGRRLPRERLRAPRRRDRRDAGLLRRGDYDLVGFIVGVVERDAASSTAAASRPATC